MQAIKISSYKWAVGILSALLGALILVAYHQFTVLLYFNSPYIFWLLGSAFLVAGLSLISLWVINDHSWLSAGAFLLASSAMLVLAASFALTGSPLRTINFTILGLGALLSAGLTLNHRLENRSLKEPEHPNLLVVLIGLSTVLNSLVMLFVPATIADNLPSLTILLLRIFGLAFLPGGVWLLAVEILMPRRQMSQRHWNATGAYVFTGLSFLIFLSITSTVPSAWSALAYYGVFGLALVTMPWLHTRSKAYQPNAARTRLALILVIVTSVAVIVTAAGISELNERAARAEALTTQGQQAIALAGDVASYFELYESALEALASLTSVSMPQGLSALSADAAQPGLAAYVAAFPDAVALGIYDDQGNLLVQTGETSLATQISDTRLYQTVRQSGQTSRNFIISPNSGRPIFSLGTPIKLNNGQIAGLVVAGVNAQRVSDFMETQSASRNRAYLVDETGRVIAHPDPSLVSASANLSTRPAVIRLKQDHSPGAFTYWQGEVEMLSGYAPVPGSDWGVVIERPVADALSGVSAGRNLAFVVLLVLLPLMALGGVLIANQLAQPLQSLAEAADQFAAGNPDVPLPKSNVSEISYLVSIFANMRSRLEARTGERDRAEQALREANRTLEKRVAERTAELETANQRMSEANQQLRSEIEQRMQAETALARYTRQLERSNRELEDFAYIASHDLQEPLRKVQAFSQRVVDNYKDDLDQRGQDYLDRMHSAAARMQIMINDLLSYSRVSTQGHEFQTVDLNKVAQEVVDDLEVRLRESGGRVALGELPTLMADRPQMRQLLQNLINNALKFRRPDEAPVVKVYYNNCTSPDTSDQATQTQGDGEDNNCVQLIVEDNGIGFDEKYLDRIFQPFQRLHGRTEYQGSGIGLAVCRKIVERHNGRITARSHPGEGATFIISLPLRHSDETLQAAEPPEPVGKRAPTRR